MRRPVLLVLATFFLLAGATIIGWRYMSSPTQLRVAVGPAGSEDARLIAAAAQYLSREHETLRFKVVPTEGEADSARAIDEGEADLAVVRTDVTMPARAQTVVVLHKDAFVLVAPAGRGIDTVGSLKGHTVGIVKRLGANAKLLETLLAHYEIPVGDVKTVVIENARDVEAALRSNQIDAAIAVGSIGGRNVLDTVASVLAAGDGAAPVFIPVTESDAIAQRSAALETFEILRGAFGGASPRPADTVKTIGVSHRLVANSTIPESTISELTRLIFVMRPTLASDVPLANRIEAPESSNSAVLPVHPGALAYYDGEVETFFEKYDDFIYIGAMLLSVVASGAAGLASTAASKRRARTLGLLDRLLGIVRLTRSAQSETELDGLEHETDEILAVALAKAGTGGLDDAGVSAFTLGLDQARHAIAERRLHLARGPRFLKVAAE